jgi:hypothetical protein
VPASDLASTRFAVRYGELTFAERFIDTFKGLDLDSFGPLRDCPELFLPTRVVEIIDRRDNSVVRRASLSGELAETLFERITGALGELDVTTFERTWLMVRALD